MNHEKEIGKSLAMNILGLGFFKNDELMKVLKDIAAWEV